MLTVPFNYFQGKTSFLLSALNLNFRAQGFKYHVSTTFSTTLIFQKHVYVTEDRYTSERQNANGVNQKRVHNSSCLSMCLSCHENLSEFGKKSYFNVNNCLLICFVIVVVVVCFLFRFLRYQSLNSM